MSMELTRREMLFMRFVFESFVVRSSDPPSRLLAWGWIESLDTGRYHITARGQYEYQNKTLRLHRSDAGCFTREV